MSKHDAIDVAIIYNIESCLGNIDFMRYRQKITGRIIEVNEYGEEINQIGKIVGDKLLLSLAINDGISRFDIFDVEAHLMQIGEIVYDFDCMDWHSSIYNFYGGEILNQDLLILNRIEILPPYRKNGIGKYVIKDFYSNFIQGAALFALKCFPIQHEAGVMENKDEWNNLMGYDKMERNFKKAFNRLSNYYKKIGFDNVPELESNEIMFINPVFKNKNFKKIILNDW
jgi:GNAT superfamily N-acetyltransferase